MNHETKIFFTCLLALLFSACNHKEDELGANTSQTPTIHKAPIQINDMAYTSPWDLYTLYVNDPINVIHYNIARLLAETELIAGANFAVAPAATPYDEWHLTTYPKVVLNYDNTPKYYEFGYVCNGQIVATITTYAKKEIAGVIAYIFNEPLNYDCPDLDYYIGNYPNRYYGTGGVCYLKNCNEELDTELREHGSTDEQERELMLLQMTDEDINGIQQDMNDQGENLDSDIDERNEYWQLVDDFIANNPNLLNNEETIGQISELNLHNFLDGNIASGSGSEADYVNQLADLLDYEKGYFHTGILEEYRDPRLQLTYWDGFCGPAACAWVYRGKYDSYNGYYLPILGDGAWYNDYFYEDISSYYAYYDYQQDSLLNSSHVSDALNEYNNISAVADNGLSACFYNETVPFWYDGWQFPLYHGGLNRGFRAATNDQYHVTFTCKPYDWITLNDQPVIIAINCDHYIVAFGYGVTRKRNGNVKDKYFLVTDNGYTTSPSYHPYMRKKNFWNLHYGLTQ